MIMTDERTALLSDHLHTVLNEPVTLEWVSFDTELAVRTPTATYIVPVPLEVIDKVPPSALAVDIGRYLSHDERDNAAFSFEFTEYRRWVSPGDIGQLRADKTLQDSNKRAAYQAIHQKVEALTAALERLIDTTSRETVMLPRTARSLHQMALQQHWQRLADPAMQQGFFELHDQGHYPCSARWDQQDNRTGWMLSSTLGDLRLTESQKAPVMFALGALNDARDSLGWSRLTEKDIQLSTCHDITYVQFQSLVPALSGVHSRKLEHAAELLCGIHRALGQGVGENAFVKMVSLALPFPSRQDEAHTTRLCQELLQRPLPAATDTPWQDLPFAEQWGYQQLAVDMMTPGLLSELRSKVYETQVLSEPMLEALSVEIDIDEPDVIRPGSLSRNR